MKTFNKINNIVSQIPKGKVSTYQQIADILSIKNPRIIGFALHANKNPQEIPCHRVIKNDGTLAKGYAFGGKAKQKENLQKEGVKFNGNKIDLGKYLYQPQQKSLFKKH